MAPRHVGYLNILLLYSVLDTLSFITIVDRDQRETSQHAGGALARLGRLRPVVPRKLALWGGPILLLTCS